MEPLKSHACVEGLSREAEGCQTMSPRQKFLEGCSTCDFYHNGLGLLKTALAMVGD